MACCNNILVDWIIFSFRWNLFRGVLKMIQKGKKVSVLGLGKSGVAAAKLLANIGAAVEIFEQKKAQDACPEAEELINLGIPVFFQPNEEQIVTEDCALLVKNPGVPYSNPAVQRAIQLSIPVITEVELAGSLSKVPFIGITGSNGKTTTTTLVGEMLAASNISVLVAGNIGRAISAVVQKVKDEKWLVTELSSFQLKGTSTFHPKIAALLNVVPAHLDYHQTMEDYIASKAKLFQNMDTRDFAVFNYDNPICREVAEHQAASILWFSLMEEMKNGTFLRDGWIIARWNGQEEYIIPVSEVALLGDRNLENALAAVAITLVAGGDIQGIRHVLTHFKGVEHRLEYVATKKEVRYYNDSKATNAQAAITALTAFPEAVIWIGGGLDRGTDFNELVPILQKHVKAVVAYGQTALIMKERAREAGITTILQANEVDDAVRLARDLAVPGDVVVLSPACASWDQYTSFEERGRIFKQTVHTL
jgi:UDP-N-acetylmuramoylalanine--D-glutamate ligase